MLVMALVWLALLLRHRKTWKLNPAVSFTSLACAGQRYAGAVAGFFLWCLAMALLWVLGDGTSYPCFLWVVDEETRCGGKA